MAPPLDIVIVGGSIAGLFSGIALTHSGHNVTIIEQDRDIRESHMAGVCLGRDGEEFMSRHDRLQSPYMLDCIGLTVLRHTVRPMYVNGRRAITSWDTLYFRLRANFDGFTSSYFPSAAPRLKSDGTATYQSCSRVQDITLNGTGFLITILNTTTEKSTTRKADWIIGADGPNSFIRRRYLPTSQRNYAGNIAWRGTVPEHLVSDETRKILTGNATVHLMHHHHTICYLIPGANGDLTPGNRLFNFLWYTNESPSNLKRIMTDNVTGHQHHHIVPAGHVRSDVWASTLQKAETTPLAPPFLELLRKIQRPFIQVITEFCSPQATFEDSGKVVLVGDALALYRPHTAFSGTQAAFDALRLEEYVNGKLTRAQYDDKVLRYARIHWSQSEWWGKFYQSGTVTWVVSLLRYWGYCWWDRVLSWWSGEAGLLRGFGRGRKGGFVEV